MQSILPVVILLFTYLALSASLQLSNMVLGFLIAMGVYFLLRQSRRPVNWRRIPRAFTALAVYMAIIIRNTIVSGINVARIVIQPRMPLNSGIIAFPAECESDRGRAIGAHAISLAPGELLIEMDPDGTMYIHSLDVEGSRKLVEASQKRRRDLLQRIFDTPPPAHGGSSNA